MKRIFSVAVLSLLVFDVNAASNARPAMSGKMIMSAPRYTASVNQLNTMGGFSNVIKPDTNDAKPVAPEQNEEPEPVIDMREAERNACINNNIGIGNTFVWASKYSDTSNYANMVEDVNNPQNNVCFVRVELKSDDSSRVSVDDVPAKYFMWGENIECGSWANASEIEKRILDARKGARIGGIVASSVGASGVGFGAMELFGNDLIGGSVKGQKADDLTMYESYFNELSYYQKQEVLDAVKIVNANGYPDAQGQFINKHKQ